MPAFHLLVCIYSIATTFGVKYWYHSPRLIHQHYKNGHQKQIAKKINIYKAHNLDYDRALEQQEIDELYDISALIGYDNYYDQYFDEMASDEAAVADITDKANVKAGHPNFALFRIKPGVKPPFIQVRYPTTMSGVPRWGSWQLFKWSKYEAEVDKGIMTPLQIKSVYDDGSLRKRTEMGLLKYAAVRFKINGWTKLEDFTEGCLADLGSKTAKSDLDFTFIYWVEPHKVVHAMVAFYNRFYSFYGDWPLLVYDMNFYIASGFTKKACWDTWPVNPGIANLKKLFKKVANNPPRNENDKPIYELGHKSLYKNKIYWNIDMYISYLFVKRRLDLKTLDEKEGDAKLKILTQYSAVFYWCIEQIIAGTMSIDSNEDYDDTMIFLKTLLYAMNYWSDESYVTNAALQLIFKKAVKKLPELGKFLAVLDCTAFITRYHHEAETKGKSDLWFWNKISKYMMRNGKLLQTTTDFIKHKNFLTKAKSKFPESVYNFLRDGVGAKGAFDEDKLGLEGYEVNYYALAEQWSGEWDGDDGREEVLDKLKKIRGDMPLDYVSEPNTAKPIWTIDYEKHYSAFLGYKKVKLATQKRIWLVKHGELEPNKPGVGGEKTLKELETEMLGLLKYDDSKRHADFIDGQYKDLGRLFFRGRKIWDYMQTSQRLHDKDKVNDLLKGMVSNVEENNIKASFQEKAKVGKVTEIFNNIIKRGGSDLIPSLVKVSIATSDRTPARGNPSKKVLSYELKQIGSKKKTVMMDLMGAGKLNPFKKTGVRGILTG